MADPIGARLRERERLINVARDYVRALSRRIPVAAAVIAGSVARGDFNVWSDIDVVVVAEDLPARALDRQQLLLADAAPGVQPTAFTPAEFRAAVARGNRLAREALEGGVALTGGRLRDIARTEAGTP